MKIENWGVAVKAEPIRSLQVMRAYAQLISHDGDFGDEAGRIPQWCIEVQIADAWEYQCITGEGE